MTQDPLTATATLYRADDIVPAVTRAQERGTDRLLLANRKGLVVEIMADDLLATISALTSERDALRAMLVEWARVSKGLGLDQRKDDIADFDDELAGVVTSVAAQTLAWRQEDLLRRVSVALPSALPPIPGQGTK